MIKITIFQGELVPFFSVKSEKIQNSDGRPVSALF